jgi:hypothetical protein
VTKAGFTAYTSAAVNLTAGQTRTMNVTLTPTGSTAGTASIIGVVTDTAGNAVQGAQLVLSLAPFGGTPTPVDTVQSAANGSYAFDSLAAGRYGVTVTKVGFAPYTSASIALTAGQARTLNVTLIPVALPNAVIKGTVTDSASANALTGAKVVLRLRSGGGAWQALDSTTTSSSGAYSFTSLNVGTYSIVVSMATYVTYTTSARTPITIATTRDTVTANVALVKQATGNLLVFVQNASGALAGASVAAAGAAETYSGTTAASGWITFSAIPTGAYDVTVSMTGYNTSAPVLTNVAANANDTVRVTLQAATGASKVVKGTAKTATGTAVAGAQVVLSATRGATTLTLVDSTDATGAYAISGIPVGYTVANLSFTKSGYAAKDTNNIAITADTTTVDVILQGITAVRPGGIAVLSTAKTSVWVYSLDGRLMAAFKTAEANPLAAVALRNVRTQQPVVVRWSRNGRFMQQQVIVR